ncbi:hypothetical protein Nepgr_012106 [Nepenthes gracilis]|uniref:Glucosidase 2 subunit beta n=1 Tax=Nepenthes gracilis TaxID=150966 RepID=A0AAD3SF81_NEPGR|nr:hypothetical protein Nepgr_012106 [Nepenthes gracilis]
MEMRWVHFVVMAFVCVNPMIARSASLSLNTLRGISPGDEMYYKASSEFIKCKDGSKRIRTVLLNDDFCDCPDGSDEPGTSACHNGRFYCRNAGHVPLTLFSSRVNDGICDCCDGSDEYDDKVRCPNTCWEDGKVARDKLKKKIATYQDGVALREKEVQQAKLAYAKDEALLLKLQNEERILKGLVEELKVRKEQIEKAEEKERLEKANVEKIRKEAGKELEQVNAEDEEKVLSGKEPVHSTDDDVIGNFEDSSDQGVEEAYEDPVDERADNSKIEESPSNTVEAVSEAEENNDEPSVSGSGTNPRSKEETVSESTEGLSKEELGRLVASRWTGENNGQKTRESSLKDNEGPEETPKDVHNDEYDGYSSEIEDDDDDDDDADQRYDDHDSEDHIDDDFVDEDHVGSSPPYNLDNEDESFLTDVTTSSNLSWLEKIKKTVRSILQSANLFPTPVDISDAARVRKEYDESNAKLSKLQSKISSLSQKLKHDFGPEKEFYLFSDRCFESKRNKYVYKVCPFKQATQIEGHSTTRLGRWERFDDSYKAMLFSSGDRCWNGPDRSLKVKLRCGLENEITDVDEPSRCEYVALLSTLNVCLKEKLQELQHKLELMNKEQPQNHDEL